MDTEFTLTIKGFKSKAQVEAFVDWYSSQGEQDAIIWFEEFKQRGKIDVDTMNLNESKKRKWDSNNMTVFVEPS